MAAENPRFSWARPAQRGSDIRFRTPRYGISNRRDRSVWRAQLYPGRKVELDTGSDGEPSGIAAVAIVFRLQIHANRRIQFDVRINFRNELDVLCGGGQTRKTQEQRAFPKILVIGGSLHAGERYRCPVFTSTRRSACLFEVDSDANDNPVGGGIEDEPLLPRKWASR